MFKISNNMQGVFSCYYNVIYSQEYDFPIFKHLGTHPSYVHAHIERIMPSLQGLDGSYDSDADSDKTSFEEK